MVRLLHLRDHLLAAAGIARHRVHGDRVVFRQDARRHERPDERDRPGRIAARIGHQPRAGDLGCLILVHLGEAVDPVGVDPVRRGGVDEPRRVGAGEHLHGFPRAFVGQAQDGDVRLLEEILPHRLVAPFRLGDGNHVEVGASGKPRPDLQPGGAVFAVDEYSRFHGLVLEKACVSSDLPAVSESGRQAVESKSQLIVAHGVPQAGRDNAWRRTPRQSP